MVQISMASKELLTQSTVRRKNHLDDQQFEHYFSKFKSGCVESRNTLVECNMFLVKSIAKAMLSKRKAAPGSAYYAEVLFNYMQEGALGLMHALDKFDPEKGRFSTYATPWIKEFIRQSIYNESVVKLSVNRHKHSNSVNQVISSYEQEYGCKPTLEIIAELTGLSVSDIEKGRIDSIAKAESFSFDAEPQTDMCKSIYDLVSFQMEDSVESNQFEAMSHLKDSTWIAVQLSKLGAREQYITRAYFGIGFEEPMGYKSIGLHLGITKERVRQIMVLIKQELLLNAQKDGICLSALY
ncbi:sigma-70 family RNA polymerase sigma factor [Vibrio owensii]|uniref:sigma-70 family RNA polymerase sigma factor n=1 Tax=Vibrio owensii TaxID=696485 RepID=UPI003CC56295